MDFIRNIATAPSVYAQVNRPKVPLGKQVKLWKVPDGDISKSALVLPEDVIILGEDLVLNVSSTFSSLMNPSQGIISGALNKLTGINKDIIRTAFSGTTLEGKFASQSLQIWENTSPLSFSITVALYMDFNAEKQVMNPTKELMKLVVPNEIDGLLLPPGPSASFTFANTVKTYLEEQEYDLKTINEVTSSIREKTTFETYKISIGKFLYLDDVIVTRAEPIISGDSDQYGMPIWSKVRLDIQTTTACTKQMIDDFSNAKIAFTGGPNKVNEIRQQITR